MSPIESMAGSVIVCGFDGPQAPAILRRRLSDGLVAGLILFQRNISGVDQASELIGSCAARSTSTLPILVCVDQEGGRVARFAEPVLRLPPMRALASKCDPQLTREAAVILAQQLRSIGVNLDFAPVLDVDTNPSNPVIGDRAFGNTPEAVIEHALAFADGLHEGGVLSCGKHFPGHGDTDLDSHFDLPVLRHARDRLDAIELRPFRAAANRIDSMMTAHVVFETLDPAVPATMSPAVIDGLLRRDLGFAGPVFSDDLEMKAITDRYSVEEAGVLAIAAGCDLLLVCSDLDAAERLRSALVAEAERSEAFSNRLDQARSRANALRRRVGQLPPAPPLRTALNNPRARAIEERLKQLV